MTNPDLLRLSLVAGLRSIPQQKAGNAPTAVAATRIDSTVTQPFDSIEEHVGSIYRYACRLTGKHELAEDLTQETLLRGWRNRHKLRDPRAARLWLLTIVTNLWNDELRRKQIRTAPLEYDPICPRIGPGDASDERENVRLAFAAMDALPERQRQVLYLVTCENLAHDEAANVLGISDTALKANLSLARREMRRRLKDIYESVCGKPIPKRS